MGVPDLCRSRKGRYCDPSVRKRAWSQASKTGLVQSQRSHAQEASRRVPCQQGTEGATSTSWRISFMRPRYLTEPLARVRNTHELLLAQYPRRSNPLLQRPGATNTCAYLTPLRVTDSLQRGWSGSQIRTSEKRFAGAGELYTTVCGQGQFQ